MISWGSIRLKKNYHIFYIEDAFKLAAYGVKQGGIGSILAGGFSLKRSSTTSARSSVNDRPTSMDSNPPELPVVCYKIKGRKFKVFVCNSFYFRLH